MARALIPTVLLLVTACRVAQPERPSSVPRSAKWAGGSDGGVWIDCEYTTKEPAVGYKCRVFHDTGQVWSQGDFSLARMTKEGREFPAGPFVEGSIDSYEWYDGMQIHVSEDRILVPDGWIDHPFGDGHGKRVRYELGEEKESQSY